jgi:AcrR family transcriptional regulator
VIPFPDTANRPQSPLAGFKPRVLEIVATGRQVLEEGGSDAMSMHRIAELLGIRTPSLYKHVASKRAIEVMLIVEGMWEQATQANLAIDAAPDAFTALAESSRRWALANPGLFALLTCGPLPVDPAVAIAEGHRADVLTRVFGDRTDAARWYLVAAYGLASLELNGRTDGWDVDAMWRAVADTARMQ